MRCERSTTVMGVFKKIVIIIIIIKEAVFKSERTSSDNWEVFEKVAAQTVTVNLFGLCAQYKVCEARSPLLVGRRRVGRGGLFDGKTFVQLCGEDYKLLTCSIKELIPAAHGPLVCDSNARRLVSKFGFFSFLFFFFPFFSPQSHTMERKERHIALFGRIYTCKLLFNAPPPLCRSC